MISRYTLRMTMQIAVKLPDDLVEQVDRLVADGAFKSRSQAVRSGLEAIVAGQRRQEIDLRYRDAMTRLPETSEELAEATDSATSAINDEPWEPWW